jgi:hypothetical protein
VLQCGIEFMLGWCVANFMKLKINKTNVSYCVYTMSDYCIVCTDIIEKLGVIVYMKLHFHQHADDIFSQSAKILRFILSI